MQQTTKIFIAIPSKDTWKSNFGMSLVKLFAYSLFLPNTTLVISNEKSSTVARNRNNLVKQAIDAKADYIFFLDDDMSFPHNTLEILLKHNLPIVGCNYSKKHDQKESTGRGFDNKWLTQKEGLEKVKYLGAGCLLINLSVFIHLDFPYFMEDLISDYSEDAYFCKKAREAEYDIICDHDLSKHLYHIGDKKYSL